MRKLLLIFGGMLFLTSCGNQKSLTILVAAGLKAPFQKILQAYQKRHPEIKLNVDYAGGGPLLIKLRNHFGDIFVSPEREFMDEAISENLINPKTVKVIAYHEPVLVIKKEINIDSVYDLLKVKNIRFGIPDPRGTSIGRISREIFKKLGIWKQISKEILVEPPTINQILLYLKENQLDAAVIWKELAFNLKNFKIVEFPKSCRESEPALIGISAFSKNKNAALNFEAFLIRHRYVFEKYGFLQ